MGRPDARRTRCRVLVGWRLARDRLRRRRSVVPFDRVRTLDLRPRPHHGHQLRPVLTRRHAIRKLRPSGKRDRSRSRRNHRRRKAMTKPKQDEQNKKLTLERETIRELTKPTEGSPGVGVDTKPNPTNASDTCQSV